MTQFKSVKLFTFERLDDARHGRADTTCRGDRVHGFEIQRRHQQLFHTLLLHLAPVESNCKHRCVVQIELDEWTDGVGEPRDVDGKRERNDMADTHVSVKRSDTILRTSSSWLRQSTRSSAAHHDGEKLLCEY